MNKLLLLSLVLAACKWQDFDDLADETWVEATDSPSVGSTDYGLAILATTTSTSGGQLAVVGNDVPTYSTLDYTAGAKAPSVGPNAQKLGIHFIAALSDPPIFVGDGNGKIALVERALDGGNIAVFMGPSNQPVDAPFASTMPPDAATWAGANVIVAAGPNLVTVTGTAAPTMCMVDPVGGMPFAAAALASDGTDLFVWTKTGLFVKYAVSALTPCATPLPAPGGTPFMTAPFMPGPGARIHLVTGTTFAVLAAKTPSSTMASVYVVDTATMTQVGTGPLSVAGLKSSTLGTIGTTTYLVLGVPDRSVEGVIAGQVDLYELDTTTGMLGATAALQLWDAQPESGANFGRGVALMKYSGTNILVVAANDEVFTYFKTSLYDALP